ncbi:cupin domain-containing protein [Candidatus Magnetomonas plexicatena]|uniref:cupin domain-containing protein n=1 Tax=Candidatus Magnetomonas plexicatena TaxID=2552947 RepID=UPI001103D1B2|nr:cupin domain-containing protein [Nitrospirales bacterium LBB_01]
MDVSVVKPDEKELKDRGVNSWPIWSKEASKFDWFYDDTEECYILEGKVEVVTKDGKKVEFGKGDFVTFPKGLACSWEIKEAVRKHYNFK